jgi:hypothetical protein
MLLDRENQANTATEENWTSKQGATVDDWISFPRPPLQLARFPLIKQIFLETPFSFLALLIKS